MIESTTLTVDATLELTATYRRTTEALSVQAVQEPPVAQPVNTPVTPDPPSSKNPFLYGFFYVLVGASMILLLWWWWRGIGPVPVPNDAKTTDSNGSFCTQCGATLYEDANFCHACGTKRRDAGP